VFTGLVEALTTVVAFDGQTLALRKPDVWANDPIEIGESIAVNGCCLTVTSAERDLTFDLSEETVSRTAFYLFKIGTKVNLERATKAGQRLGGHIVQGHVDMVGYFLSATKRNQAREVRFQVHEVFDKYLIDKGSIAIDGISLTVIRPEKGVFETAIIPHTWANTNLHSLEPGDQVNVEFDMIAKYVEKMTARPS